MPAAVRTSLHVVSDHPGGLGMEGQMDQQGQIGSEVWGSLRSSGQAAHPVSLDPLVSLFSSEWVRWFDPLMCPAKVCGPKRSLQGLRSLTDHKYDRRMEPLVAKVWGREMVDDRGGSWASCSTVARHASHFKPEILEHTPPTPAGPP